MFTRKKDHKYKFRFLFFVALFTGMGVIAFQLYWLYNAYKLQQTEFATIATNTLQRSNDKYLLNGFFQKNRSTSFFSFYTNDADGKLSSDSLKMRTNRFARQNIDPGGRQSLMQGKPVLLSDDFQKNVSRLFSQLFNKPYNIDSLSKIYQQDLLQAGISLPFTLTLTDTVSTRGGNNVFIATGYNNGTVVIAAHFKNREYYLIKHTIFPIIISFVLMLLTAGCLWYMWRNIQQQRQLADIKNDFINNMTHELKTPISILKTTHEALNAFGEADNQEKTFRYLQFNVAELNKLEEKVNRILDITQYESGKKLFVKEKFNLKNLISEIIDRFTFDLQNNITFQYYLASEEIETDIHAINTIVSNLIDNAIKYADKKLTNIQVAVHSSSSGSMVLRVSDNGPGIPLDQQGFIFDKFYRVPTGNLHNVKGYGLGLSYVKQLVTLLNGSITVHSQPGKGTTFTIQIPEVCKE